MEPTNQNLAKCRDSERLVCSGLLEEKDEEHVTLVEAPRYYILLMLRGDNYVVVLIVV